MPRKESEQTEDYVEGYLVKQCMLYRALCCKNQRLAGMLDRTIYWWDGVVDIVETKRPVGGRFEPLQPRYIAKLRKMGHNVHLLYTRAMVDQYIAMRAPNGRKVGTKA